MVFLPLLSFGHLLEVKETFFFKHFYVYLSLRLTESSIKRGVGCDYECLMNPAGGWTCHGLMLLPLRVTFQAHARSRLELFTSIYVLF